MKHPILISLAAVPLLLATSSCGMLNDDPAALVDAALEDNDFAGARVHLARLVADNPQDMQLRLRYADTLLNLGDPIGAQGALEALPANGFEVICFPVKVHRGSAGWTRAVAVIQE